MRARLERKIDGCREYFVRKGRSPDLRTSPADLENGFSDQFVLHMAESRADLERLTPETIAKIRGMAVTYHMVPADAKALSHFPKLEMIASFGVGYDHVDFGLCARAQYRRHQHARRADRRSRRRRDGASDLDRARVRQGRPLSALRPVADAELSLERRLAARPQGRDRRHGPHRAGDRTPARGFARAGFLSFAQSVVGASPTSTIPT